MNIRCNYETAVSEEQSKCIPSLLSQFEEQHEIVVMLVWLLLTLTQTHDIQICVLCVYEIGILK